MKRFAIGLTILLLGLGGTQAGAVTSEIRWATITGTATTLSTTVECTGEGYASQCPSGSCSCMEVSGAVVAKVTGQPAIDGTGTADVFLTFDNGSKTAGAGGDCTPFFGIASLTTTRSNGPSSETLNLNGVNCSPITPPHSPILGGFGISASPVPVNGRKGYGKVSGFLDPSGSLSLTLHGLITQ
jgi:hypothetical protein